MIRIKNKINILKTIIVFLIFGVFILSMIIIINRSQIRPNENEVVALEVFLVKKILRVNKILSLLKIRLFGIFRIKVREQVY